MTVAEFISARLAEEKGHANAMRHYTEDSQAYSCPATRTEPLGDLEWGEDHCDCGLAERKAKRLREIAAMQAIVNAYESAATADRFSTSPAPIDHFQDGLQHALEQIAAIWSDHLDYRPERDWP